MFLIIPFSLTFFSILGVAIIVWLKRPYLEQIIATEDNTVDVLGGKFSLAKYGLEFFPEFKVLFDKLKINEHKNLWLIELEKFLRKTRLISLKVDRLSDVLIKKVRRIHLNGQIHKVEGPENISVNEMATSPSVSDNQIPNVISSTFLKNEEERLILEIAKNPKDAKLYETLGDLYIEMASFPDAKESYEAAIELSPQNESLKQKFSLALEKLSTH